MQQIFIVNPKGGCGKTTIATQLASYCAQNHPVLLVDHDPQRSASDWLAARPAKCQPILQLPKHAKATLSQLAYCYAYGQENLAEVIIHDLPAAAGFDLSGYCLAAEDRVILPVLASPTDIKACLRFMMALQRQGLFEMAAPVGLVANRHRAQTRYAKILQEFLVKLELPLVTLLRDTQNYVRVMELGLSIFDIPPGRVEKDLRQWQPLIDWLAVSVPTADKSGIGSDCQHSQRLSA